MQLPTTTFGSQREDLSSSAVQLRGPAVGGAVDDVLPEDGHEGNPGGRLPVGARLALRHCRLGPSGHGGMNGHGE